VPVAGHA